jgi:hypothetical protein
MPRAFPVALALSILTLFLGIACGGATGGDDVGDDSRDVRPDLLDLSYSSDGEADESQPPDLLPDTPSDDADLGEAGPDVPDAPPDFDKDGVQDGEDNCPRVSNPLQENKDDDLYGDACDPDDTDSDGVPDYADEAPLDKNWPGRVTVMNLIYAHTAGALYTWNVGDAKPQKVADFTWPSGIADQDMTDLAIDRDGLMYGISFDHLYRVSATSGKTRSLGVLSQQFNGLTVIERGKIDPAQETLVAISNAGNWVQVTVTGTSATFKTLGSYNGYSSAGDAFCIEQKGTWAAVLDPGDTSGTILVEVNPSNGNVKSVLSPALNADSVYGLAGVGGVIYAFDASGQILAYDLAMKKVTTAVTAANGQAWWGAAVSTRGK